MLGAIDSLVQRESEETDKMLSYFGAQDPILLKTGPEATSPLVYAPFTDAMRNFEERKILDRADFDKLRDGAKRKAFAVAGMAKGELLDATHGELNRMIKRSKAQSFFDPVSEQWIYEGPNLREFKKFARDRLESSGWTPANPSHVETIYRTNIGTAYSSGRFTEMTQPSVLAARPYWQIQTVKDSRQRATHRAADGTILPASHPFWRTAFPPFGFNCFLPGTIVRGDFVGASRALYSGKAFEFTSAIGSRLSVTANHPVLTTRGFVPARELMVGDKLVSYFDKSRVSDLWSCAEWYKDEHPATVEQVFGALAESGCVQSSSYGPDDFHGEAVFFDGQVDVVGSYRELLSNRDSAFQEQRAKFGFKPSDSPALSARSPGELFCGNDSTSSSVPSRPALALDSSWNCPDSPPLSSLRFGLSTKFDSMEFQRFGDGLAADADLFGKLIDGVPGLVAVDEIVDVREFDWFGHVYDLETRSGWLFAGGIVAGNCRCRAVARSQRWVDAHGGVTSVPTGLPDEGFDSGTAALLMPEGATGDARKTQIEEAASAKKQQEALAKAKKQVALDKKLAKQKAKQAKLEAQLVAKARAEALAQKAAQEQALAEAQRQAASQAEALRKDAALQAKLRAEEAKRVAEQRAAFERAEAERVAAEQRAAEKAKREADELAAKARERDSREAEYETALRSLSSAESKVKALIAAYKRAFQQYELGALAKAALRDAWNDFGNAHNAYKAQIDTVNRVGYEIRKPEIFDTTPKQPHWNEAVKVNVDSALVEHEKRLVNQLAATPEPFKATVSSSELVTKRTIARNAPVPIEPVRHAEKELGDIADIAIPRLRTLGRVPTNKAIVQRNAVRIRTTTPITSDDDLRLIERGVGWIDGPGIESVKTFSDSSKRAFARMEAIDEEAKDAVVAFSNGFDTTIRDISTGKFTFEEVVARRNAGMLKRGHPESMARSTEHCHEAMRHATELERAFWGSPDGIIDHTYRGISELSTDTLNTILGDEVVTLGGKPSSTSAVFFVARNFAEPSVSAANPRMGHSIVFKFTNRKTKGIPMSSVSSFESEKELLLHGNTKWRVTDRKRINHPQARMLDDGSQEEEWLITVEEID